MDYRQQLLAAMQQTATAVMKPHSFEVQGWGKVYIRSLTLAEVDAQDDEETPAPKDGKKVDKRTLARATARLLCDETGARVFDPDKDADVAFLGSQPWKLLRKVLAEAKKLRDEEDAGN